MFDIVISGGTVVDGTGKPRFKADVGIRDGKISETGKDIHASAAADMVINAHGRVVSPGFIDVHSHSDLTLLVDPLGHSKLMQGVTSEVNGNCGFGVAPISKESLREFVEFWRSSGSQWFDIESTWSTFGEYLDQLERQKPSLNSAVLAAHGTIRFSVMKVAPRKATEEEIYEMQRILKDCMNAGACGLSSGLRYVPGCYADIQELVSLCKIVKSCGGLYATHIRSEGDNGSWEEAVREAIEVARQAGIPLEISHLKALGKNVWNSSGRILELCESIRNEGLHLDADQYPYDATHTGLTVFIPSWLSVEELAGLRGQSSEVSNYVKEILRVRGGPERIMIISSPEHLLDGKTIAEVCVSYNLPPEETIMKLIIEYKGEISIISKSMIEEDIQRIMKTQFVMVSTDGYAINPNGPSAVGLAHPRSYGTYPRILGRYVREMAVLTLEEAIRKMTSLPAKKFLLKDRGVIREGAWADLVVFDPDTIQDQSTFESPTRYPKGIDYVLVNGKVTVDKQNHTGERSGKVLRLRHGVVS